MPQRVIHWQPLPGAGNITFSFNKPDQDRPVDKGVAAIFENSGRMAFVRFKLCPVAKPSIVSKESKVVFVTWHGGAGQAHMTKRGASWLKAIKLDEPIHLIDCIFPYRVELGVGDDLPENLEEIFLFPGLPLEIAPQTVEAQLKWLQESCVGDLLKRERNDRIEQAKILEKDQLRLAPPRLPHEDEKTDHHALWRVAMNKLLCKKWPNLSTALKAIASAGDDQQKRRVLAAYVADYTAIFGVPPEVKTEDMAELAIDPYYIGLMQKSFNAGGSPVKTLWWQLAVGWLAKGYYQMNEAQLEVAFNRDWGYQPRQHKGNTLAKYAREKIGLRFARKPGRPEKVNALPPG